MVGRMATQWNAVTSGGVDCLQKLRERVEGSGRGLFEAFQKIVALDDGDVILDDLRVQLVDVERVEDFLRVDDEVPPDALVVHLENLVDGVLKVILLFDDRADVVERGLVLPGEVQVGELDDRLELVLEDAVREELLDNWRAARLGGVLLDFVQDDLSEVVQGGHLVIADGEDVIEDELLEAGEEQFGLSDLVLELAGRHVVDDDVGQPRLVLVVDFEPG